MRWHFWAQASAWRHNERSDSVSWSLPVGASRQEPETQLRHTRKTSRLSIWSFFHPRSKKLEWIHLTSIYSPSICDQNVKLSHILWIRNRRTAYCTRTHFYMAHAWSIIRGYKTTLAEFSKSARGIKIHFSWALWQPSWTDSDERRVNFRLLHSRRDHKHFSGGKTLDMISLSACWISKKV